MGKSLLLLSLFLLSAYSTFLCGPCQQAVKGVANFVSILTPDFVAQKMLEDLCLRRYDSEKLCKRVGQQIAPLAIENVIEDYISPEKWCSYVCENSYVRYYPTEQVQRIESGVALRKINLQKFVQTQNFEVTSKDTLKILHISDIHLDKNYTENSSIICDYPICCHAEDGFPDAKNNQAKPYGNKNCDSPPKLLDAFLNFMQKQQEIDIILATGDFSAHNQWQKTDETVIKVQKQIQQKILKSFPNSILIKSQGNNDYSPDHQYNVSKSPKLIKKTIITVGETKLTFLALNTIAFDDMNLYLLGDQSYAIFQLFLLEQILSSTENVYLLGHIPPTLSGVAEQYFTVFRALITKYSDKIKNQFYGHTHSDQLTINTKYNSEEATGFGFVCPSLSPLFIGNSRSRVYTLLTNLKENDNGISDYTQYSIKDLSANVAQWKIQYNFRQKYHLAADGNKITLEQIQQIKKKVLSENKWQNSYLRSTGLDDIYNEKSYCWMLDDRILRKKCFNKSPTLNDKISTLLDAIRGDWGYKPHLAVNKE